jgi:signal transduction histidine kinase
VRKRTDDLSEALDQQTATSEVLKVISSSPGDLQPVFQAMLENATRICEASFGNMLLYENGLFRRVALHNTPSAYAEFNRKNPLLDPKKVPILGRLVQTKQAVQVADIAVTEPDSPIYHLGGARTLLVVPMLKDDALVGGIGIYRKDVRPFTDKQVELVSNFAAQAVIAIENARLLNELRQRTDDLTESLEQQTATSEVLEIISSSAGELEPVFSAMLTNATRICEAAFGSLLLYESGRFRRVAIHNAPPAYTEHAAREPFVPQNEKTLGILQTTMQAVHIVDMAAESPESPIAKFGGARSFVTVPMNKDGELIGVIGIYRHEVRPFSEKQIELLTNFAAQAVIAIENTRLLSELRESLQQQTATADVLKIISRSTFDLKTVLNTLVETAVRVCEADIGNIARPVDGGAYRIEASYGQSAALYDELARQTLKAGKGSVIGRTALSRAPVHILDAQTDPDYELREALKIGNYHTMLGVPLVREGNIIGVFGLARTAVRAFTEQQIELVTTFADQAVIAIENVRLFDEIQDKSRQLAEASQHKSQFLANMSHELRTPLNAILGYTELITDGVYGEPTEKMMGVLKRLQSNGKHLLGLINDVLDLSKIEAGQLKLDLADYSIQDLTQAVYSAVEPLAADKKLAFKCEVAPNLPAGHGDGRRLTQVLLNLVGNAIKFTDAGEVVITADASNAAFNLSVRDTGPGISAADQAKLFQEFRQADNSITRKKGGTGLGLAISKRIVEMHGGKIWLESQVGQGSTFFVALPVKAEVVDDAAKVT